MATEEQNKTVVEAGLKTRIVGRSPRRTLVQLVIASIIVGAVLAFLGLSPIGFWNGIFDAVKGLVSAIGNSASEVVVNLVTYLLLGAVIVVPVWLISRLLSGRGK